MMVPMVYCVCLIGSGSEHDDIDITIEMRVSNGVRNLILSNLS